MIALQVSMRLRECVPGLTYRALHVSACSLTTTMRRTLLKASSPKATVNASLLNVRTVDCAFFASGLLPKSSVCTFKKTCDDCYGLRLLITSNGTYLSQSEELSRSVAYFVVCQTLRISDSARSISCGVYRPASRICFFCTSVS